MCTPRPPAPDPPLPCTHPTLEVIESSLYVSDLFRAVLGSGAACRGAVAPDVRVRYALGPEGDPSGDFCALQVSGDGDGDGFVSVPLSRSAVPPARGAALNRLAAALAAADAAGAAARERLNFPVDRPRCAARLAAARDDRSPGALQAYDYAGVCVLFAAGVALSLAAKALQARPSGRRRRRRDPHPQPQPSPQAPDGGKGGDWPGGHAGAPTGGGGGGGESAAAGVAVAVVSEDAAAAAAYGVSDAGIELRAGV